MAPNPSSALPDPPLEAPSAPPSPRAKAAADGAQTHPAAPPAPGTPAAGERATVASTPAAAAAAAAAAEPGARRGGTKRRAPGGARGGDPARRRRRVGLADGAGAGRAPLQANRSGRGAAANGNYRGYYHRRLGRGDAAGDPRLALLDPAWAAPPARVLDVGCNDGAFTVALARRFAPAAVVGADIDPALVLRARARAAGAAAAAAPSGGGAKAGGGKAGGAKAAPNVRFEACDVAAEGDAPGALAEGGFDVVLALSVSKWIHLHAGDDGLKRFFARVLAALKPGGVFVLEPQPSRSYKKARKRGAVPGDRVMSSFKLKPEQFPQFLVGKNGGFEKYTTLRGTQAKNTPFGNRPIYAFFKAKEGAGPAAKTSPGTGDGKTSSEKDEKVGTERGGKPSLPNGKQPAGAAAVDAAQCEKMGAERSGKPNLPNGKQPAVAAAVDTAQCEKKD